jgi:TolA-binding protein
MKVLRRATLAAHKEEAPMVLIKKKKLKSSEEIESERQKKEQQKAGIQDEFQAKGFELVEWMQDHRQAVMGGIALLVLGGLLLSGWFVFKRDANESASSAYQAAAQMLETTGPVQSEDSKKIEQARAAFMQVAKDYPRSDVAKLATLYAGHLSLKLGDTKQALASYDSFIASVSTSDKLYPLALRGLASAYEASNEPKKSLETLEKIGTTAPALNSDDVLLKVAKLAQTLGETQKAKTSVQSLLERFPESSLRSEAEALLASLPEQAK